MFPRRGPLSRSESLRQGPVPAQAEPVVPATRKSHRVTVTVVSTESVASDSDVRAAGETGTAARAALH